VKKLLLLAALAACGSKSSSSHAKTYKLSELPVSRWLGDLPVSGTGTITVDLSDDPATVKDWTKVTGTIDLACDDCRVGDDKTPIDTGRRGAFGGTISFSHIAWTSVAGHVDFKDGEVRAVSHWRGDLDLDLEMHGTLARAIGDTPIDGCFALRASDALRARDPKIASLLDLSGMPKGADGRYYLAMRGTLAHDRRLPSVCTVAAN